MEADRIQKQIIRNPERAGSRQAAGRGVPPAWDLVGNVPRLEIKVRGSRGLRRQVLRALEDENRKLKKSFTHFLATQLACGSVSETSSAAAVAPVHPYPHHRRRQQSSVCRYSRPQRDACFGVGQSIGWSAGSRRRD